MSRGRQTKTWTEDERRDLEEKDMDMRTETELNEIIFYKPHRRHIGYLAEEREMKMYACMYVSMYLGYLYVSYWMY